MFGLRIVRDNRPRKTLGKWSRRAMVLLAALIIPTVALAAWLATMPVTTSGSTSAGAEAAWATNSCGPMAGAGSVVASIAGDTISYAFAGLDDTTTGVACTPRFDHPAALSACNLNVGVLPPGMSVSSPQDGAAFPVPAANELFQLDFGFAGLSPSEDLSASFTVTCTN